MEHLEEGAIDERVGVGALVAVCEESAAASGEAGMAGERSSEQKRHLRAGVGVRSLEGPSAPLPHRTVSSRAHASP